jgi:cytochrome c biogenesis protein CcdA
MKKSDKILSELLKKNILEIDDDSFTRRIVNIHLSTRKKTSYKPFLNFNILIVGISSVLISIGLVLSIITKTEAIENLVFKEQYGIVILIISLLFLIYFWVDDLIIPKQRM